MKRILLLDFDGVIADTFELCFQTRKDTGSPLPKDEYRTLFEGNIYEESKKVNRKLSKENKTRKSKGDWYDFYTPGLMKISPVECMEEVIEKLSEDYTLLIVSSTESEPIENWLEKHSLLRYFDKVFGSDVNQSKVAKIEMIFEEYKTKPENCLFITDTLGDMREADRMGVRTLGVSWGYHFKETLERGDFYKIVDEPKDVLVAVNQYFS